MPTPTLDEPAEAPHTLRPSDMTGGRHRSPASEVTLKGDLILEFPSSITTATRQRESTPAAESSLARTRRPVTNNGVADLDVWIESRDSYAPLLPSSSIAPSPTPSPIDSDFGPFVTDAPPSPPPKDAQQPFPATSSLASKGGFYSKSTSIAQARSHKSLKQLQGVSDLRTGPARPLKWRDKGQEMARARKGSGTPAKLGITLRQVVGAVASMAVLSLGAVVYVNSRGKNAVVKHMQRREQVLAASLAPTSSSVVSRDRFQLSIHASTD